MRCTALVADDREDVRALVKDAIADDEMSVIEACDGAEAWERFQGDGPQVVITDLRMPHVDGLELLRRIRRVSSVPVLLLTAFGDIPTAVAAMKAGATEFLLFPDALGPLRERIATLVAQAGSSVRTGDRSLVGKLRQREQRRQRRELEIVLRECGGNLALVSRRLELSRSAVFYRARKFGMLECTERETAEIGDRPAEEDSRWSDERP